MLFSIAVGVFIGAGAARFLDAPERRAQLAQSQSRQIALIWAACVGGYPALIAIGRQTPIHQIPDPVVHALVIVMLITLMFIAHLTYLWHRERRHRR
jgi:hypothetical protein